MSETQPKDVDTDELDPTHPVKRLEETIKQADFAAQEINDAAAARYARKAAACAESALVMLQGPEILQQPAEGVNDE